MHAGNDESASASLGADDLSRITAILETVPDPEIPVVSIVELGIVRGVRADPPAVFITPTYTGCPATLAIQASVREALDTEDYRHVAIVTCLSPPWSTEWISASGRQKLKAYGIAPPSANASDAVECPQCGSLQTVEVSRFGSTPCKALWRCTACLEPFDRFKCH